MCIYIHTYTYICIYIYVGDVTKYVLFVVTKKVFIIMLVLPICV